MKIIWCMIPEIGSATDRIFSRFGPFFAPFTHPRSPNNPDNQNFEKMKKTTGYIIILYKRTKNDNHMIYGSWDMTFLNRQNFFVILGHFFALLPFKSPKNENIKKMKKIPRDIIILHNCTKTHDQMLYCSWDMVRGGCNCYFSFWAIFCPFTPLTPPKKM